MEFEIVFPVIALIAGWFLNELTRYLGLRREKRGAIGKALSDLLEIRGRMANIQFQTDYVIEQLGMPHQFAPRLKQVYRDFFALPNNLYQRYDDAVTLIASFDPILGYKLRSEHLGEEYIKRLSSLASDENADDQVFLEFLSQMEDLLIPRLDSTIRELARKHGCITYFRVVRILNEKLQIPEDMRKLLQDMKAKIDNSPCSYNNSNQR